MSHPSPSGWTDALVDEAIALYQKGRSASQIARDLYPKGLRASRNAVIGLIHRRGVQRDGEAGVSRQAAGRRAASQQAAVSRVAKPPKAAPPLKATAPAVAGPPQPAPKPPRPVAAAPTTADAVPLFRLTHSTCRFPVGPATGADQLFCGGASDPGAPYCKHHARIAFNGRGSAPAMAA